MAQKESKILANIFLGAAIALLVADLFVNCRLYYQVHGGGGFLPITSDALRLPVKAYMLFISMTWLLPISLTWGTLISKVLILLVYSGYIFVAKPSVSDTRPSVYVYVLAATTAVALLLSSFLSPYYCLAVGREVVSVIIYTTTVLVSFGIIVYSFSLIGKWLAFGSSTSMKEDLQRDPFGREERRFAQERALIKNKYSVNIPYTFIDEYGKQARGYVNLIQNFRAVQVLGAMGSGKSYAFFLPGIQQMLQKGFSMILFDFKYPDLSEFAYNCLQRYREEIEQTVGPAPEFRVISFDVLTESDQCNILQPNLLNDFTIDAYGVADAFLIALNKSWSSKEGDFFPESAKNLAAAGIWALKIYRRGAYCSLPHLIEFLSMDVASVVQILMKLQDTSLTNVVRPYAEAYRDGAVEQLQGQMGTVRIALSRLTSPTIYWVLSDPENGEALQLDVNNPTSPKILCLGSSPKNQRVNNVFLSLFIVQLFRFVNAKGRRPCGVMLDEVVTLSFPKLTLDTLIATARSNMVAVWLGYQDLQQLVRDLGRESAEAIFQMIGNTFAGQVSGDTAKRVSEKIGRMRLLKKSVSINADGEPSYSYSEQYEHAVPESYLGSMSQGTFAGQLADNYDQPLEHKVFYGQIEYKPPFQSDHGEKIPMTPFWANVFEKHCLGFTDDQKDAHVKGILEKNFNRVVSDIQRMREDLLEPNENEAA
jgi:hypothetical protein